MLFAGVFLVSLGTLIFEISLIRVLSFTIWYHFAYVVLSTALLGFGAAGALVAVRPAIGTINLERALSRAALGAASSAVGCLALIAHCPFDPMKIFEGPRDLAMLGLYEVAATAPFFFAGIAISLALRAGASRVDRLYFWDLAGAGLGCALSVVAMNVFTPPGAVVAAAFVFAIAACVFGRSSRWTFSSPVLVLAAGAALSAAPFTPADSKHLMEHKRIQHLEQVFMRWTALFRTDVVSRPDGASFPFREWGLSRATHGPLQPPWGYLTHDGTAGAPIYDLRKGHLDFLDDHILRIPYLVTTPSPRVLVIGVGGGRDVAAALRYGASDVTGIELDPVTVQLLQHRYADLSAGLFTASNVHLSADEGRHFASRTADHYDLIQITAVDTLAAQASGAYVLAENYLYTVEALQQYLRRLSPRGILSFGIGEWNYEEPQAVGRMMLVAQQALRAQGIWDTTRHMVIVSSRNLITEILVRVEPFTDTELHRIGDEVGRLDFVPLVLGGLAGHPLYQRLLDTAGAEHRALLDSLPYVIEPVTDDSPFFFRFFRWTELLKRHEFGPAHTTSLGQLVLLVLLVTLSMLAGTAILLPMMAFRKRTIGSRKSVTLALLYFMGIGLGFMLLEISLMQRLVLYLGYPTYALSVVLFSLLTFLGFGSALSRRWALSEGRVLPAAVAILTAIVLIYRYQFSALELRTLGSPIGVRVAVTTLVLAPLGVTLGLFFPLGIRRVEAIHGDLVPWAWCINGAASVVGSILAVIIAMTSSFTVVWILAIGAYAASTGALLALSSATQKRDFPTQL